MKQFGYIKIEYSCLESNLFHEKKFDKLHAWIDLISLALTEDKEISVRGITMQGKKGSAYVSRRMLAERWGWSEKATSNFLAKLERNHLTNHLKDHITSCISITNYSMYVDDGATKGTTYSEMEPSKEPLKSTINSNISTTYKVCNSEMEPQKEPLPENLEKREKEKKKETLPPVPPIKEIKKEKEKKESFISKPEKFFSGCLEGENDLVLTPETSEEKKKPAKKKSEEEYTLTYRARLVFGDFYKSKFGEAYYFSKQDMKMLTELLKKIKYSRTKRAKPLSVDDESLLSAFKELLSMIQTKWVIENFSISNITSKYNEIVQDIKNNRNGKSNYTTEQERNRLNSERQKAALAANVAKLNEYYSKQRSREESQRESDEVERQIPTSDPFDFL